MNARSTCIRESIQRALTLTTGHSNSAGSYADDLDSLTFRLQAQRSDLEARLTEITATIATAEATDAMTVYCRSDEHFPKRIAEHRPEVAAIYVCGNTDAFEAINKKDTLALVGARRASAYGREVSYSFANDASSNGVVVITTLSLGVPGAANRGALQGSGVTIGFLAGPPNTPYPRSHRLLYEQVTQKGCTISVMPPGLDPSRAAFTLRNELLGALAEASVFVEGTIESGAMHTLDEARRVGNMVGAVPGPITSTLSAGPNALIAGDARLIRYATDLYDCETTEADASSQLDMSDDDRGVFDAISAGHDTPRQIAQELPTLAPRAISAALGRLELLGHIVRTQDAYRPS